ncbi:MAG: hypothetical protein ACK4ZJ_17985, partial [Allorhizobium sp.]
MPHRQPPDAAGPAGEDDDPSSAGAVAASLAAAFLAGFSPDTALPESLPQLRDDGAVARAPVEVPPRPDFPNVRFLQLREPEEYKLLGHA